MRNVGNYIFNRYSIAECVESTGRNVQKGGGIRACRNVKEKPGPAEAVPVPAGNLRSDDGAV